MPTVFGTFPHTSDKHTGSAARDTPGGLAGLNSSGFLLIPGNTIYCFGDNNQLDIQQKNPDLNFLQIFVEEDGTPQAYMGFITSDNKVLINKDKGAAYGVAPLDYFARIPWDNNNLNLLNGLSSVKLGDSVLYQDVTVADTGETSFELLYNVKITSLRPDKTDLRIKFYGKHSDPGGTAEFQLRVEGNVITTFSIVGSIYTEETVDTELEVGDTVQLFGRVVNPGIASAREFRICGEIVEATDAIEVQKL